VTAMDAATLFLITTLNGREAEQPVRDYPTASTCQTFIDNLDVATKPERLANTRYECRRHYRISR